MTRIQRERFSSEEEYDRVAGSYIVNNELLKISKADLKILHPLPRLNEIDREVDWDNNKAAYFRQMKNGLLIRAAILTMILGRA